MGFVGSGWTFDGAQFAVAGICDDARTHRETIVCGNGMAVVGGNVPGDWMAGYHRGRTEIAHSSCHGAEWRLVIRGRIHPLPDLECPPK